MPGTLAIRARTGTLAAAAMVVMSEIQIALPWGEPGVVLRGRRRPLELADRLHAANRQVYRLRDDLAEARALAEKLRRDLDAERRARSALEARLLGIGLREPVRDDGREIARAARRGQTE